MSCSGGFSEEKGLTHPILKDIEDILKHTQNIFEKESVSLTSQDARTFINFVKDLCYEDSGRKIIGNVDGIDMIDGSVIIYNVRQDYEKRTVVLRRRYKTQPRKGELNQYYQLLWWKKIIKRNRSLEPFLRLKSARSESGVLVITVLTSPGKFSCPKDCYYCPDERERETEPKGERVMPRSYLSSEPACKRAAENRFDPRLQVFDRIEVLRKIGHEVDKVEILVLGGTWSFYDQIYQREFICNVYYAVNVYFEVLAGKGMREMLSLEEEQKINETAPCRIIGITLETRPDFITLTEIKRFREYGCTRVQLGIQHTDDEILNMVNRDHTVEDSVKAVKLLKENGFKVDGHFMPDLPGSDPEKDMKCFQRVLAGEDLQVDYMKVYPTTITPFTKIKEM